MSTVLPDLERRLHNAAVRRTRRRRGTRRVAPVLAVAAIVIAVVLAASGADREREAPIASAPPTTSPLAAAYAAFASPGTVVTDPDPAALPHVTPSGEQTGKPVLDLSQPVLSWTLLDRDGLRIEAWSGASAFGGPATTCFPMWRDGELATRVCTSTSELERAPLSVIELGQNRERGHYATLLVSDAVAGVKVNGKRVAIEGNVALVRSAQPICSIRPVGGAAPAAELEIPLPPRVCR